MKKFKVNYTVHSNMEWYSTRKEEIVEAKNKEQAKEIIKRRSDCAYEFVVGRVEEVSGNE